MFLVKEMQENLYRVCTDLSSQDELIKINHVFPVVRDCIQGIDQSQCEIISVSDSRDAYHTLRLEPDPQKYCRIIPFYGLP